MVICVSVELPPWFVSSSNSCTTPFAVTCSSHSGLLGPDPWKIWPMVVRLGTSTTSTVAVKTLVPLVFHVAFSRNSTRGCSEPEVVQPCLGSAIAIEPSDVLV